jgi:hypothetical protein
MKVVRNIRYITQYLELRHTKHPIQLEIQDTIVTVKERCGNGGVIIVYISTKDADINLFFENKFCVKLGKDDSFRWTEKNLVIGKNNSNSHSSTKDKKLRGLNI